MRLKIPNRLVRDFLFALMRSCNGIVKEIVSRINVRDTVREIPYHSVNVYAYRNEGRYRKKIIEETASFSLNVSEIDKPEYKEEPGV